MIPPAEIFSSRVRKMGISDSDYVVVYDRLGVFSSPRIWWTFQLFGHENIAILDGGLPKWLREKLPVTDQKYSPKDGVTFQQYAQIRIRGSIIDFLRKNSNLCRTTIQMQQKAKKAEEDDKDEAKGEEKDEKKDEEDAKKAEEDAKKDEPEKDEGKKTKEEGKKKNTEKKRKTFHY